LFTVLLFSGLGSQFSARLPLKWVLGVLVALVSLIPLVLPWLFDLTLGLPLWARLVLTVMILGPIGSLMGVPFPSGIHRLLWKRGRSSLIPWAWAVNGSTSVMSAVLAALLALSFGFRWVLWSGALCYLGVLLIAYNKEYSDSV
jgi:hypothetical protein